jgi:hypothetical protein
LLIPWRIHSGISLYRRRCSATKRPSRQSNAYSNRWPPGHSSHPNQYSA